MQAETFEAGDGWEYYTGERTWDAAAAADQAPGAATPEDAVVHFYASRIRGDGRWEEVVPAERSDVLVRKLEKLAGWRIRTLRLVARKARGGGRYYVKVALDVEREGRPIAFRDDVTVERHADRWWVTRPPT